METLDPKGYLLTPPAIHTLLDPPPHRDRAFCCISHVCFQFSFVLKRRGVAHNIALVLVSLFIFFASLMSSVSQATHSRWPFRGCKEIETRRERREEEGGINRSLSSARQKQKKRGLGDK